MKYVYEAGAIRYECLLMPVISLTQKKGVLHKCVYGTRRYMNLSFPTACRNRKVQPFPEWLGT